VPNPVLLDTCAAIWLYEPRSPIAASRTAIRTAQAANLGVYLSPFTAWEIVDAGVEGAGSPDTFARSLVRHSACTAGASAVSGPHSEGSVIGQRHYREVRRATADRIIAATARLYGYRVITRDSKLLDYAKQGHIPRHRLLTTDSSLRLAGITVTPARIAE